MKNKIFKKLILIDLDGTTLMDDHISIHPKTRSSLEKATQAGHIVCICTGRVSRDAEKIYKDLNMSTILVSLDGGHISDPVHKQFKRIVLPISETIIKQIFKHEVLNDLIDNAVVEYYNHGMSLNPKDKFFVVDTEDKTEMGDIINDWKGPASNLIIKLKSNTNFKYVVDTLKKDFGNSVIVKSDLIYGIEHISEKPILIINNKFVNKGFAAEMVAQYYNISLKHTIAFGDQLNDYEMLKTVGTSVALKNANPKLQEVASIITDLTNNEGGVGDTLDKLLNL
ncbi:Cof-type HAD-IIB family hydrolase [Mesoplasma corruscae]|uniref:Phosphatase n=1 Tax=Mesoplasma corruscae TaxID=216874 RepID=A0A2S5RHG0_9MOLU|nr:Cof-type HAD-IIB family hydrolase [Mesoplasma corruscae]PPE06728.1 phosphatase [Mesoplasma corruscae]